MHQSQIIGVTVIRDQWNLQIRIWVSQGIILHTLIMPAPGPFVLLNALTRTIWIDWDKFFEWMKPIEADTPCSKVFQWLRVLQWPIDNCIQFRPYCELQTYILFHEELIINSRTYNLGSVQLSTGRRNTPSHCNTFEHAVSASIDSIFI